MKESRKRSRLRRFWRHLSLAAAIVIGAYVVGAACAKALGYYFNPFGSDLTFVSKSGAEYAFFIGGYEKFDEKTNSHWGTDESYLLYRQADSLGFVFRQVPDVYVGYTYNNYHRGTDLVVSPDGTMLFMRRNTTESAIWTDVLDISVDPPRTIIQGPDCCMKRSPLDDIHTTDGEGLTLHGQKVLELATKLGMRT